MTRAFLMRAAFATTAMSFLTLTAIASTFSYDRFLYVPESSYLSLSATELADVEGWADDNGYAIVTDEEILAQLPALMVAECDVEVVGNWTWLFDNFGWLLCDQVPECLPTMSMRMNVDGETVVCAHECDPQPLLNDRCDCDLKDNQPSDCVP